MENKIVGLVLKAKNTLVKFLTKTVPPLNTLIYGPSTSNITKELKDIAIIEKKRREDLKKNPDLAKTDPTQYAKENNELGNKKQGLLKKVVNPIENPGIIPITNFIQKINSFNLCNPLILGINAAFPKGSPVNEAVRKVQTELREIQLLLQNFRVIEGNKTAVGTSLLPQPIQQGEFKVRIEQPGLIPTGTTVFIQQTNNNTIFTNMKGVISSFNIPGANISNNFSQPAPSFIDSSFSSLGNESSDLLNPSFNLPDTSALTVPSLTPSAGNPQLNSISNSTKIIEYTIQIETFDGIDPPYKKSKSGNTVFDDNDEPVLATFTNWQLEYETKQTTDIRELSEDIQGIVDALRDINFKAISNFLDKIPSAFGNFGKLKRLVGKIAEFTSDVSDVAQTAADVGSTATLALSGGLTSRQVIERSKVLTEFYDEILPILNFDLSLENIFKKQIGDVNKVLRGVIPYKQLAIIVKTIKKFVIFVTKLTQFTLSLINFLQTIIKTILMVAKVIRDVKGYVEKAAIALPALFATAGIINTLGKVVIQISEGLDRAIPMLEEISSLLDFAAQKIGFLQRQLMNLANELGRLQQTFETCDNLDKRLDLNSSIQGLVSLSTGIGFPENLVRNQIQGLIKNVSDPDKFQNAQDVSEASEFGNTVIITKDGTILVLPGTVWGFGPNGQIVFGGDLISGATGINFEETRGQDLRRSLRQNFTFYTFNKFKGANNANLVEKLQAQSIEAYAETVEKIDDIDVGDKFGNFQEVYLGYLIRIQEEKPISDTSKGESNLTRRRGVAFDSEGSIVVGSDLTFSDDLNLIVDETKYKIKRNVQLGVIDVGLPSNQPIPNDDAIKLEETIGANPLQINNKKAQANNTNADNVEGSQTNTDPVAMRTGNSKFEEAQGEPATLVSNQSSPNKTIDAAALIQQPFAEFIEENPSLKKMKDTFNLLQGATTSQLNDIMSSPGVFNLNPEELSEKLKNNILNSIDPNPEKIKEIGKKTSIWLEGLKKSTKIDYEQLTLSMHPKQRAAFKPFEEYYDGIEEKEFEKWILFLLSKNYTRNEIQSGIDEEELRDEYKIKFDQTGKGGKKLKVVISRKNERLRSKLK